MPGRFKDIRLPRALVMACAIILSATSAAGAEWYPEKPIELVIMAGKGGGADKMGRFFKQIVEKEDLSPFPLEPVNMPGDSGADALAYMQQKSGDPHVIMVTLNSFYTTPLRQPELDIDIMKFTPVARMAEDTFLLWVHMDSGIDNLEEFVKAAAARGGRWVMAGTGTASEDNLLTDFLNSAYGLRMQYKSFKGGGRVARELAEKRANSTVNNPAEQDRYFEEGITRPLAAFTPQRLQMFRDVPTFKEKGNNMVYFMQRSIVAPPGLNDEAAAFYRNLFREVYETKEWQDYMNKKSLRGNFITGSKLLGYWAEEQEIHRNILLRMGKISTVN